MISGPASSLHLQAILRPFNSREAVSLKEAAVIAGRHPETLKLWCVRESIGRLVAGRWMVSRVALAMWLDDDASALSAYLSGERGDVVLSYFERLEIVP